MLMFVLVWSAILSGCQQQMADQPSYRPLETSSFFANGQASRHLVAGTIARGHLEIDAHFYTGRKPGANRQAETERTEHPLPVGKNVGAKSPTLDEKQFVDTFPYPVTMQVLEHGRDRYMIYCAVCHDPIGTGNGKIVERGYTRPPSYHIPRLRAVPVGHLFALGEIGWQNGPGSDVAHNLIQRPSPHRGGALEVQVEPADRFGQTAPRGVRITAVVGVVVFGLGQHDQLLRL